MDDPERDWTARARAGDRAALVELYEAHKRELFGLILRYIADRQLAEDCFQEVWHKVLSVMDRYDAERAPFRAWLHTIARHQAIDMLRRDRSRSWADPVDVEAVGSAAPGPDRAAEARRGVDALSPALDRLSARQRVAVLLRHEQGLRFDEIAAIMGVPEATAKTLVHRGVLALRAALPEWSDV